MFVEESTLDDLMNNVLSQLLKLPFNVKGTRGTCSEIFGIILQLNNPQARLSRTETKGKPFSALGELLWYLSKSNKLEFIEYYIPKYREDSEDGITIYGGYGSRLFNMHDKYDQIDCIIKLLREKPHTRRAVIQLFDASDTFGKYKEIPCTCTLQFAIRNEKLNMFTSMRSNDAFIGLPHDIFCFTLLQEIIARTLGFEIGKYSHAVGSLHLYSDNIAQCEQYLDEGYQSTQITMPAMPIGDPWDSISLLSQYESKIRLKEEIDFSSLSLDHYWIDLIKLLQIHTEFKCNNSDAIVTLKSSMQNKIYDTYIDSKLKKLMKGKA